ncbi:putative L-lactate dehydrogenase domain protein [Collimonas arenae]|nr:putative L-lactate dehydrogenase domain protein [Collimonas arenae]
MPHFENNHVGRGVPIFHLRWNAIWANEHTSIGATLRRYVDFGEVNS